jgi:hypothetical protein
MESPHSITTQRNENELEEVIRKIANINDTTVTQDEMELR